MAEQGRPSAPPAAQGGRIAGRGRFVALEGVDGCGKGTLLAGLAGWIHGLGKEHEVLLAREPTREAPAIRARLAEDASVARDGRWFARAFTADRRRHAERLLGPVLASGAHVLCDRYALSTLAYQQVQGVPLQELLDLQRGLPVPDLTLLLDCPVEVASARRAAAGAGEAFDRDRAFQESLRAAYLRLAGDGSWPAVRVLDASRPAAEVLCAAAALLRPLLEA